MAQWYYNRPEDKADSGELAVAQHLEAQLGNEWLIRWGFYYAGGQNQSKDREGDFILLGPDGRVLVMEVKSGALRHWAQTGRWENGGGSEDNPAKQLHGEWAGVIQEMKDAKQGALPYVGKALCLPNVHEIEAPRFLSQMSRDCLIFKEDLLDMVGWWARYMVSGRMHIEPHAARRLFKSALVPELEAKLVKLFLSHSDQLFEDFKSTEFELLQMLEDNGQWMVEGGVGTGKTFMALRQAAYLAERGAGARVILIVFNLGLARRMEALASKLKLSRGSVEVLTWGAVAEAIVDQAGGSIPSADGMADKAKRQHYQEAVPACVNEALGSGAVQPQFDALVVLEAQDHDTRFGQGADGLGWWDWYFALLKDGARSPIALFYDPMQRPDFRDKTRFEPEHLRAGLNYPVHIKLRRTVGYTRPIFDYLQELLALGASKFAGELEPHENLPVGPDVEKRVVEPGEVPNAVEALLKSWKTKGLCRPEEVVLIGLRKELSKSSLGGIEKLCGRELIPYEEGLKGKLAYLGAHRSRGLDFRAVIIVDFESPETLFADEEGADGQEAFFLAASRARQVLGVVAVGD